MHPKNLKHAPKVVGTVLWGLVYWTFLEAEMFLLLVLAVLVGWHLGWEWGVIVYFAVYLAWRMVGHYLSLLIASIHRSARPVMNRTETVDE